MAGADRMTIEQVVRKVLLVDHADVVRESVRWVVEQLMESEVSELVGAELGERRPDDRATHRNGYRPRRWDTRAGEIELQIPKLRQGSYFPSFLRPRKRSEQAPVAVVQQAYVRSEEHTSELQSRQYLVCRLLVEKKKIEQLHVLQTCTFYDGFDYFIGPLPL